MEDILNQSLCIAVVKKNIFDMSMKVLTRERIRVSASALMEVINGISLHKLEELLASSRKKEIYTKKLEALVKSVIRQYVSKNLLSSQS
jgi:hypothetical protein